MKKKPEEIELPLPEIENPFEEGECVQIVGTNVYFAAEIDDVSVQELITALKKLEKKLLKQAIDLDGYEPRVRLYIKSDGGDIFAGFSAMDHIRNMKIDVTTVADGCCASAATFLLLAGKKREIGQHGYVLIHQLATDGFWGKYEDMKDEMKNCDQFMKTIREIYDKETELPTKKLNKMLKRDVFLNAKMCKKYKVVHKIV